MQIISGLYKHHSLESPHSDLTHPMGSREKNALFNMLSPYLAGANVLDAYAGTGALGLEALSRGATQATFVEKSPKIARVLQKNVHSLPDIAGQSKIIVRPVADFCPDDTFDVIIADPPYQNFIPEEINYITTFLRENGVLALSHPQGTAYSYQGLTLLNTHDYAGATISLFQKS